MFGAINSENIKDGNDKLFAYANITNLPTIKYINDDFSGGEINFPDQGIEYKPKPGDILIYQSKFLHEVKPMTGSPRYNIGIGFKGPKVQ
jgi:predicted 2-oxoglutarate/Fe(II)-dependent dioxygenase YbiX